MSISPVPRADQPWNSTEVPVKGLLQELEALTFYVTKVYNDLASVGPAALRHSHIPKANDQLGAVVEATENAANQIMDACDVLGEVAGEIGGASGDRINNAITTIFEACGFQDLTGQRIVTVTNTLAFIEGKLADLMSMLGIPSGDDAAPVQTTGSAIGRETHLLNGPQLPGKGINQDEIDRLIVELTADGLQA